MPSSVVGEFADERLGQHNDSFGNLTKQTDATGRIITYTYDANGREVSETSTRVVGTSVVTLTTTNTFDAQGRPTGVTYADGSSTSVSYNSIGQKSSSVDQLGRVTTYTYDAIGRLATTTYPDNSSETITYDANGRPVTKSDRADRTTTYYYDAVGNRTKIVYPDGTSTTNTYDGDNRLVAVVDELGKKTTYDYDAGGRVTGVTDALGHTTLYGYDADSNQTSLTDPLGNTTTTVFDEAGRPTTVTYPDGSISTTQYDAAGNKISFTDPDGKITKYSYDAVSELTQVLDPMGGVTSYTYDDDGNVNSQTDANGHTTVFAYDTMGRRTKRTLPLGQSGTMTYDAAGNLQSKTDFNGRTTLYSYDSFNRLTTKTPDLFFDTLTVSYSYTPSGKLASVVDSSGVTTYVYDARDHLITKTSPAGKLSYTYDAAGQRLTLRSDGVDGVAVDYAWDAAHHLTSVTDRSSGGGTTTWTYDPSGNMTGYSHPNGVNAVISYDAMNRVSTVAVASVSGPLTNYSYTYGHVGNRLSVSEANGRSVNWSYDNLYRLTGETIAGAAGNGTNGAVVYDYDAVGNRTATTSTVAVVPPSTTSYDPNDRSSAAAYDANGNTTTSGANSYAYDFEDRLATLNSNSVVLGYDGQGSLVSRAVGGVMTQYLVDEANPTGYPQIVEERVGGNVTNVLVFGTQLVSQRSKANGTWVRSYYVQDAHRDVRFMTNESGAVTDSYDYDAFGNVLASTGTTPNDYRSTSERFDSALGLEYLRARYMDQRTGRFVTADPQPPRMDDPIGLNRYIYGNADPVNHTDPTGLIAMIDRQWFGYAVEDELVEPYMADHPGNPVTFGTQLTLLTGRYVKPDIQNFGNTTISPGAAVKTWEEIKPLTPSGVARAAASFIAYYAPLKLLGFRPEVWEPRTAMLPVLGRQTYFVALAGILFYTNVEAAAADLEVAVAAKTVQALGRGALKPAWQIVSKYGSQLFEEDLLSRAPSIATRAAVSDIGATADIAIGNASISPQASF